MYLPPLYAERDTARLHALIDARPFAALVAHTAEGGLEVAHLPFVLDAAAGPLGTLRAHVARANPIWRAAAAGAPLVAVFNGPQGYVSPRWYARPAEEVPTWVYAVVHAHGTARAPLPRAELRALLDALTARHEPERAPWRPDALAPALLEELLDEIVGIELPIARLEGKLKLGQNRSPTDRARVREALAARGGEDDRALAALMDSGHVAPRRAP